MAESGMTLNWNERRGMALTLREMTDNLDVLWAAMSCPAPHVHPVLEEEASRKAA